MIWGRNSILEIQLVTLQVLELLQSAALFSTVDEKRLFNSNWVKVYSNQSLFL